MANPNINAVLDKANYKVGETMVLTVDYSDADHWVRTDTVTVTGTDQDGNPAVVTVNTMVSSSDQVLLTLVDSSGRVWTKQSDNGSRAIYTATA